MNPAELDQFMRRLAKKLTDLAVGYSMSDPIHTVLIEVANAIHRALNDEH